MLNAKALYSLETRASAFSFQTLVQSAHEHPEFTGYVDDKVGLGYHRMHQ
jgi:hypothetical protein